MTKRKFFNLASIAIFIIIVSVMVYFGVLKQGFHMDELYTHGLSNGYYNPFPNDFGEWLSSNYYNNYLTTTDGTQFEYGSVIHNQINDVHPPIYYILFHTVSSFLPYVFSKWIGISINIVIHLLTCLVLYKLTKYITDNKWVSLITVLFWGASIGAISSVTFIRMYSLVTLFQVILVYFAIKFIDSKKYIKYSLLTILTIILGGLTHYYFFLFACFVTMILFAALLYKKEFVKALIYPISALLSVILSFIIFPAMYDGSSSFNVGGE